MAGTTSLTSGSPATFFTFAVDARTGRLLWQSENRGVADITASNGVVWTSPDPLAAWDVRTGNRRWQRPSAADPAQLLAVSDGVLYAVGSTGASLSLRALSAATGQQLWTRSMTAPSPTRAHEGYVAADGDTVYLGLTNSQGAESSGIYALRSW